MYVYTHVSVYIHTVNFCAYKWHYKSFQTSKLRKDK